MGRRVWYIPVLTSWGTVKIDDNLNIVLLRPTNGLKKVWFLPLNIRFTGGNIKGPMPDRDAHVIESKISKLHTRSFIRTLLCVAMHQYNVPSECNCCKVTLGDP